MHEISALFKKLNFKNSPELLIINAPESMADEVLNLRSVSNVQEQINGVSSVEFVLIFVTKQEQIETLSAQIIPKLKGDAVFWFAYPKASSKKYRCNFNRDKGWDVLGTYGFEGVRQVAIDEDWSALRFRHVNYIKSLTRSEKMMMSEKGKERLRKNKTGSSE